MNGAQILAIGPPGKTIGKTSSARKLHRSLLRAKNHQDEGVRF